jgi:hypothetical protein
MVTIENCIGSQMEREKKDAVVEVIHNGTEHSVRGAGSYHAAQFHD